MSNPFRRLTSWVSDERAQDMVEYALLAGFVAVAVGAIFPDIATPFSTIMSKTESMLTDAGGGQ